MNIEKARAVRDFNNVSSQPIWQIKYFPLLLQNFLSEALHFSWYTEMFVIFDLKTNKQKHFSYSHSGVMNSLSLQVI